MLLRIQNVKDPKIEIKLDDILSSDHKSDSPFQFWALHARCKLNVFHAW